MGSDRPSLNSGQSLDQEQLNSEEIGQSILFNEAPSATLPPVPRTRMADLGNQ